MKRKTHWRWKYRGICKVAIRLQVSRRHLYYVLIGERRSPKLLARARKLLKVK